MTKSNYRTLIIGCVCMIEVIFYIDYLNHKNNCFCSIRYIGNNYFYC
jgi:hypothetical protein